jgi:hypothetical protein
MKTVRLQDRAELKEFMKPNTVKGKETRTAVLQRMGLTAQKPASKYLMVGGQPHKWVDGVLVPLTKRA